MDGFPELTIGEVARRAGVATSSIRYDVAVPSTRVEVCAPVAARVVGSINRMYCSPASGASVLAMTRSATVTRSVPALDTKSTQPPWLPDGSVERSASIV